MADLKLSMQLFISKEQDPVIRQVSATGLCDTTLQHDCATMLCDKAL